MEVSGFAFQVRVWKVVEAVEKKGLGLGVTERLMLLALPLLCDGLGCVRYDLRAIRKSVFPETGISLFRIRLALKRVEKRKLVSIFWTNDQLGMICLDYLKETLPERLDSLPDTPLPPWVDVVRLEDGGFKIVRTDR